MRDGMRLVPCSPGTAKDGDRPPAGDTGPEATTRRGGLRWLRSLSLTAQFSVVSSAVLLLGMLVQGAWISAKIEEQAKFHAGSAAAMFVDHIIAPFFATLEPGSLLSAEQHEAVDALVRRASERMHLAAMKIWSPDATIIYSSNPAIVGQTFHVTPAMEQALAGNISVEFDMLEEEESAWERSFGVPLIEVYVPIRDAAGRIVAVAEFYENAEILNRELIRSKRDTWMVTGVVFLTLIASLLVIVSRGSRLIDRQRHSLTDKVDELSELLKQNSMLRDTVERASRLAAEESEQYLHRLGADLHDGPAQLISFALLRLDAATPIGAAAPANAGADLLPVRAALTDAMNEVRNICAGLSMPGIASLSCTDAIASVIREHERRTGTAVASTLADMPADTPHFVKTSLCRFVQEGLNNAFRHAGGVGQSVNATLQHGTIIVEVADRGPGAAPATSEAPGHRLGLAGLSNRLENLGGTLEFRTLPGQGTRLTARMPIASSEGRAQL